MTTNEENRPAGIHLPCPTCFTTNRVPHERLADHPCCGRCRCELLDGRPVTLGGESFPKFVGNSDLPVLVDFWATWCGPCKTMAPVFAQLAAELAQRVRFGKVDVDAENALAGQFGVRSVPTLILFRGGREVDRISGAVGLAQLRQWLASQ